MADRWIKPGFAVIGMEGSTRDSEGFVARLWAQANARYDEVAALAIRDEQGRPVGLWGAMTDFSRSFMPWEDGFTQGLYLAGVECAPDAQPPQGWSVWHIPGFEYLRVKDAGGDTFAGGLRLLEEQGLVLCGAAQDYTCPATGESFVLFPIRRL
ncbi:MAG: GyrI-like domain-containing protein [Clostridia bacterium]|nr:GyrI-like domain-containing protein [Clostridia bacterium]